jgi:glycosyltransferase involved in cell wall biosynthesis
MSTTTQLVRPRISIVTPSFNQGRFIEATIRSVLDQNYPNLEYIVMDGGSTDESVDIIRRYADRLAFWTSSKDDGAADAIRQGFARATGDILAYINSDDIYLPYSLDSVAQAMADSRTDVVFGNAFWIDSDGRPIGERRQTPFVAMGYLYGGFDLQQPSVFWRRPVYDRVGGMDATYRFAFDTDLFVRFVRAGARFAHLNRPLSSFRIHPQSKSSNEIDRCAAELDRLRRAHLPYPFHSVRAACARNYARILRTWWYLLQGDLGWLARRVPDRLKSAKSNEIVGPRAKWM